MAKTRRLILMSMEERVVKIPAKANKKIELKAIPGHFATNHSHINYYLDITPIKCRHTEAQLVARQMVKKYVNTTAVDAIVCMDGCEVIGAYLAEELTSAGIMSLNSHECVNVITPEINAVGQLIFRDNLEPLIQNKHAVLIFANATTGQTIQQSIEAVRYYGGIVEGVSAVFSAIDKVDGIDVDSIFTVADVANYQAYPIGKCPICEQKRKIDAIVNSSGYSKI